MSLDFNSGKRDKGCLDPERQLGCKVLEQREARAKTSASRKGILKSPSWTEEREAERECRQPKVHW